MKEKNIFGVNIKDEFMGTPNVSRRQIISYPLVTMLSGLALKNMLENVQKIMIIYGFCIPLEVFIFPFVFFVTIFRFLIGNILHLRSIEEDKTHAAIWLCDLLVITFESMLFILMSYFIYEHDANFVPILLILCAVDASWVFSMFFQWRGRLRPKMPLAWGVINLVSSVFLFVMLSAQFPFSPLSVLGRYAILVWFFFAACLDLGLDYYRLFRSKP